MESVAVIRREVYLNQVVASHAAGTAQKQHFWLEFYQNFQNPNR